MDDGIDVKLATNTKVYYENSFISVIVAGLFPETDLSKEEDYYQCVGSRILTSDDFLLLYPYDSDLRIRDGRSANVILRQSAHKEEAFDFLKRMYTDAELATLVQYGVNTTMYEGHIYTIDDNALGSTSALGSWVRGNGFISAPCYYESENKTEQFFEIYNTYGYVSPWSGFKFDRSGYEHLVTDTNAVIDQLDGLFTGAATDFDSYIDELREAFIAAGGDALYEAVREQFEEYLKNRKE